MDSQIALLATSLAAIAILSVAHKWDSDEQRRQFEIEKRDAVIRVLKEQPRQQINVNNQNNGLAGTGKQGR